jgi:hypothetical protein
MNETIDLSFRYSRSDIVRAVRAHYASRMRPRFDIVMAIGLRPSELTSGILRGRTGPVCSLWGPRLFLGFFSSLPLS